MRRLGLLDGAFLFAESRETPMHVGSLNLFTLPAHVNEKTYLHELTALLRTGDALQPIFADKLKSGPLGMLGPPLGTACPRSLS